MRSRGGSRLRHIEHGMLDVLLAGALCSSFAALLVRLPGAEPVRLSSGAWIVLVVAGVTVVTLLPLRRHAERMAAVAALWLGGIVVSSVAIALVLRRSANIFYTAPSLLDGMLGLLALHLASRVMRWIAVSYRATVLVVRALPVRATMAHRLHRVRSFLRAAQRPAVGAFTLPAVVLADALASVASWTLLTFWVLVAVERRHMASIALIFACTLLVLECAMLIPDTLAAASLLPRGLEGVRDEGSGHAK